MKFSTIILQLILVCAASISALPAPSPVFGAAAAAAKAAGKAAVGGVDDVAEAAGKAGKAGAKGADNAVSVAGRGAGIAGDAAAGARGIDAAGSSIASSADLPAITRPGGLVAVSSADQAAASAGKASAQSELAALKKAARDAAKAQKQAGKKTPEQVKAEKAAKDAQNKANVEKAAAARAQKQALLQPDPKFNGLPTSTSYGGHSMQIQYSKGFNMKHFKADRSGLGGGNTNTVIQNPSQVQWNLPSRGTTGTGNNQVQVMVFKSKSPVNVQIYEKGAGGWALKETKKQQVSVSGIIQKDKILINHFEA